MASTDSRSSVAANLALLAASLVATLLMIALVEGALRLLSIGAPDESHASRLRYQQIFLPILESAARPDGTRVWRPSDKRLPYETMLVHKPANALRVIVEAEGAIKAQVTTLPAM